MPSDAGGSRRPPVSPPVRRCYVGTDLATLRNWRDAGEAPPGTGADAVTAALRALVGPAEQEELEHAAALAAADAALGSGTGVPLVLAVDVPYDVVTEAPATGPAGVVLTAAVPVRRWAAVFTVEAVPAPEADPDDEPALSWYAVTELDTIS